MKRTRLPRVELNLSTTVKIFMCRCACERLETMETMEKVSHTICKNLRLIDIKFIKKHEDA